MTTEPFQANRRARALAALALAQSALTEAYSVCEYHEWDAAYEDIQARLQAVASQVEDFSRFAERFGDHAPAFVPDTTAVRAVLRFARQLDEAFWTADEADDVRAAQVFDHDASIVRQAARVALSALTGKDAA